MSVERLKYSTVSSAVERPVSGDGPLESLRTLPNVELSKLIQRGELNGQLGVGMKELESRWRRKGSVDNASLDTVKASPDPDSLTKILDEQEGHIAQIIIPKIKKRSPIESVKLWLQLDLKFKLKDFKKLAQHFWGLIKR